MPEDEPYREVRYDLTPGEYLLTIYDGRHTHLIQIVAEWNASMTVKLTTNETCDIEEAQ